MKSKTKDITKTSQQGTLIGETRATFIVNEEKLEQIKAVAYFDRVNIKNVLDDALAAYLAQRKDLYQVRKVYEEKERLNRVKHEII